MKKLILLIALIPSLSMAKTVEDLNTLLQVTLKNSPEIKISKEELKISDYQLKEAFGKFLPTVKFQYSKTSLSDVPSYRFELPNLPPKDYPFMERNFYNLKLSLTQPLFTGGKLTFNLKMKEKFKSAFLYKFQETLSKVLTEVKKEYYTLCEAESSAEIAKSYLKAAEDHFREVKAFYDEELVPRRDLLEAEVKLKDAEERLAGAERNYQVALEKLRKDVGKEDLEVETEELTYVPLNLTKGELLSLAYRNRPLLKYLEKLREGTDYGVKLSYSQFLPDVVLNLSYDRTDQYPMMGNFHNRGVSLAVQFPIFEGTQRFWRLKEAKAERRKAKLSVKQAKDLIRLQVVSAYTKLKTAKKRIKAAETMVEEAKELLRDSRERYRNHVGTSTEVTDAIAYYVKAKGYLNSALADYNRALADLEYAVGKRIAPQH